MSDWLATTTTKSQTFWACYLYRRERESCSSSSSSKSFPSLFVGVFPLFVVNSVLAPTHPLSLPSFSCCLLSFLCCLHVLKLIPSRFSLMSFVMSLRLWLMSWYRTQSPRRCGTWPSRSDRENSLHFILFLFSGCGQRGVHRLPEFTAAGLLPYYNDNYYSSLYSESTVTPGSQPFKDWLDCNPALFLTAVNWKL